MHTCTLCLLGTLAFGLHAPAAHTYIWKRRLYIFKQHKVCNIRQTATYCMSHGSFHIYIYIYIVVCVCVRAQCFVAAPHAAICDSCIHVPQIQAPERNVPGVVCRAELHPSLIEKTRHECWLGAPRTGESSWTSWCPSDSAGPASSSPGCSCWLSGACPCSQRPSQPRWSHASPSSCWQPDRPSP